MKTVIVSFAPMEVLRFAAILEAIEPQAQHFHPSFPMMVKTLKDKFIKAAIFQLSPEEVAEIAKKDGNKEGH